MKKNHYPLIYHYVHENLLKKYPNKVVKRAELFGYFGMIMHMPHKYKQPVLNELKEHGLVEIKNRGEIFILENC